MTDYWVRQMGGTAAFRNLEVGELFHFPGSDGIRRKVNKAGWYEDVQTGMRYRTGAGTAVCRPEVSS